MTEFQVGDRVRATSKENDDTAEFEVRGTYPEGGIKSVKSEVFYFSHHRWNFELIERPYKLPTKPGMYQIYDHLYENPSPNIRIFSLLKDGSWEEYGNPGVDTTDWLMRGKFKLKRLVFED